MCLAFSQLICVSLSLKKTMHTSHICFKELQMQLVCNCQGRCTPFYSPFPWPTLCIKGDSHRWIAFAHQGGQLQSSLFECSVWSKNSLQGKKLTLSIHVVRKYLMHLKHDNRSINISEILFLAEMLCIFLNSIYLCQVRLITVGRSQDEEAGMRNVG